MKDYLQKNYEYWQKGYFAENVESFVFRPYGRIFKSQFNIDGSKNEKLLDFGCGQGAALKFFNSKGFDVYGVDISIPDIEVCKKRIPDIEQHFSVINPVPSENDVFYGGDYDIIIAIQSLYYYNDKDLEARLISLYKQLKPGGYIYATMMGTKCWFYDYSIDAGEGLRKVEITTERLSIRDYYVNFIDSKEELINKFHMFNKVHAGYYDDFYREDEGSNFHWTFIGQK